LNLIENASIDENKVNSFFSKKLFIESATIIVIVMLLGILLINLVRILIKFYNYKIIRQSGSLLLSFGLLNTKSTIIKPEKVQITTVSRNYFQKKLNILELKIKQATSGEKEERRSAIEIPGCNERESNEILSLLFQKLPQKGFMIKPNYRKLVFSMFLTIVLPVAGFFIFANNIAPKFLEFAYLVPVYIIFRGLIIYFGFRNYRLFINDDFIIKQSGAWDIDNEIIEPLKIQALTTSQLFWHKTADIGYLTIHTAGGNIGFQLGNYSIIKQYVNLWLYEMETSDSNWM
jgi:putative membrane protein